MIAIRFKAGADPKDNRKYFDAQLVQSFKHGELQKGFSNARLGDYIILEVKVEKPTRSLPQNSQFHKLVQVLAQESGYTFDEAKFYLKSLAVSRGYPQEMKNGKPVYFLGQPKGKPTHLATVQEMSILIDSSLDILASEFGIDTREFV